MRTAGKSEADDELRWSLWIQTLLALELLVCFGPMTLMLVIGALLIPIQVAALFYEPLLWEGPVEVIGSVLCGVVGLGTLLFLLGKLFSAAGAGAIKRPSLVLTGAIIGVIPLIDVVTSPSLGWRILGVMPIVSGMHLIYLSRRVLFPAVGNR